MEYIYICYDPYLYLWSVTPGPLLHRQMLLEVCKEGAALLFSYVIIEDLSSSPLCVIQKTI